MTPEQEAEARKLLAKIAETHEWARRPCNLCQQGIYHTRCRGYILANLEVAAWWATVWLTERAWMLHYAPVQKKWFIREVESAYPIIAVFKAVLALLKEEQADERQR